MRYEKNARADVVVIGDKPYLELAAFAWSITSSASQVLRGSALMV